MSENRIQTRSSNFELLRILAMLMIVAHHLAVHGVQHVLLSDIAYQTYNVNKIAVNLLVPGGSIGVAIFFMLTGYFLSGKQKTSILKVALQTIYYGIVLSLILIFDVLLYRKFGVGYSFAEFSLVQICGNFLRNIFIPVSGNWWFVSAYALLVLVAPLINQFLGKLNKTGFICFLLATWFFWYSCQIVLIGAYASLGRAFFFYVLGSYYRLYAEQSEQKKMMWAYAILFIIFWLLYALLCFKSSSLGKIDKNTVSAAQVFANVLISALQSAVLIPLCAWTLFSFFARIELKQSRFINTIAATTFGIYLIHDSNIGRQIIWNGILKVSDVQFASPYFPLIALADIVGVFAACSAIDFVRLRFVESKMIAGANNILAQWKERFFDNR